MLPMTRTTASMPLIRQHTSTMQSNNSSENNRSLFYKTRFCDRFKAGRCPLRSEDCSYAHEASDLHLPPENWHDKVANWRPQKFCNWFNSGKNCPYGSKCAFLHLGQDKQPLNGHTRLQEPSEIISIETKRFLSEIDGEQRSLPAKKKICFNWARTGSCSFGNSCLYAHAHTDQKNPSSSTEVEGPRGGGRVSDLANASSKGDEEKEGQVYSKRVREREFEYNHCKKRKTELAVNMEYINSKCIKWRSQIYGDWI